MCGKSMQSACAQPVCRRTAALCCKGCLASEVGGRSEPRSYRICRISGFKSPAHPGDALTGLPPVAVNPCVRVPSLTLWRRSCSITSMAVEAKGNVCKIANCRFRAKPSRSAASALS
jgi:hypothetical protein